MPIAVIPTYLAGHDQEATPALLFGPLLAIWTSSEDQKSELEKAAGAKSRKGEFVSGLIKERGVEGAIALLTDETFCKKNKVARLPRLFEKNPRGARNALQASAKLGKHRALLEALLARQRAAFAAAASDATSLCVEAVSVSPFTTGLGNEHPLENGFAFLNPYGLPYLPGSGVKGAIRRAARELASGAWGDTAGWSLELRFSIELGKGSEKHTVRLSMFDVLFGPEPSKGEGDHVRGVLSFWDVFPQLPSNELMVEVMTPHQGHYYQQKKEKKSGDSVTPHDSGQPNPITFLTVPPHSRFVFHVLCDTARLSKLAPELLHAENEPPRWKTLLEAAFEHAFQWLGFGAKTAVGYGAMRRDKEAERQTAEALAKIRAQAREDKEERAAISALSQNMRRVKEFEDYMRKREEAIKGKKVRAHGDEHRRARELAKAAREEEGWTLEERQAAARAIKEWLPRVVQINVKEEMKQLKLRELLPED
jgi:CRISPR-associated protein Cmr6